MKHKFDPNHIMFLKIKEPYDGEFFHEFEYDVSATRDDLVQNFIKALGIKKDPDDVTLYITPERNSFHLDFSEEVEVG